MKLIYLYIDGYRNFKDTEFNFGQDIRIHYEKDRAKLKITPCDSALPEGFWGERISDFSVLIGNNGAGKTSVFQYIILLLQELWGEDWYTPVIGNGILVFKEENQFFWYANREFQKKSPVFPECRLGGYSQWEVVRLTGGTVFKRMGRTKFIYMTGSLSRDDYQRGLEGSRGRYHYLYDCSTGNLLCQDTWMDVNREARVRKPNYQYPANKTRFSEVGTYFTYEQYKQIKYVFDRNQLEIIEKMRAEGYPVPVPDVLHIELDMNNRSDWIFADKNLPEGIKVKDIEDRVLGSAITYMMERLDGSFAQYKEKQYIISFLRFQLQLAAVRCAFRSMARLLSEENLYLVFRKLPEHVTMHFAEENAMEHLFVYMWDIMGNLAEKKLKESESWITLRNCRQYYIDYLYFIENADLEKHFTLETELSGDSYLDFDELSLKFSVSTKDSDWFTDFIQKYRYICNPDYFLDFQWGLSSGEYNLLSMFSSLYYIFDADYTNKKNGDYRIWNLESESFHNEKTACDSVVLMVDEADLSYHPEWQRQYISILTAFLPRIYPKGCCQNIQVILSTHSPLLLGDVPQQNVIYLRCGGEGNHENVINRAGEGTFGQNIHLLFKDSFFLEQGTIGEFARKKINEAYKALIDMENELPALRQNRGLWAERRHMFRSALKNYYGKLANVIGEPLIRRKMTEKIDSLLRQFEEMSQEPGGEYRQLSEDEIRRQIARLEEELEIRQRENR